MDQGRKDGTQGTLMEPLKVRNEVRRLSIKGRGKGVIEQGKKSGPEGT